MQDWQLIVDKYGPMVWRITYRLLGDYSEAQDCFQETFVSILELSKKEPVRDIRALLAKIANARAIDRLRRRYHCNQDNIADIESIATNQLNPEERMHSAELAQHLRQALAQVQQQEAEVFCLRFLNDLSYHRIAKVTGLKTSAVGVMLHRTKHKLRTILERQENISQKKVSSNNES